MDQIFGLDISTKEMAGREPGHHVKRRALWRALRLLDRGEQPVPAARAHEGPDFGGLVGPALGHAAALAIDGLIVERVAHRDGGVIRINLAPSVGATALPEVDLGG